MLFTVYDWLQTPGLEGRVRLRIPFDPGAVASYPVPPMRWWSWPTPTQLRNLRLVSAFLITLISLATVFYGLAFFTVYLKPHTAKQASAYLKTVATPADLILTDNHWDEGLPDMYAFRLDPLPMYEGDSPDKLSKLTDSLASAQYLVFYSNRTYGSITRQPARYPYSSAYYKKLFAGELGYTLDHTFPAYPRLLGVAFIDDPFTRAGVTPPAGFDAYQNALLPLRLGYADENVNDYDHPTVLVFRNTARSSKVQIQARILAALPATDTNADPLALTPDEIAIQQSGGTWTGIVSENGWANRLPAFAWLLYAELLALVALPLAFVIFRVLPDRGYLLAKTLGLVLVAYVGWILASVHWVTFSRASALVGLLAVAALSTLAALRTWRDMRDYVRTHWRLLAFCEVLWLAAFLGFLLLRAANPDLWHPYRGGEKPMDIAYLNAILRSTTIPPYNPWFSGATMNYYYWGQYLVASVIKALGIDPAIAVNIALPYFYALTVGGAFSVAFNLAALTKRAREKRARTEDAVDAGGTSAFPWGPVGAGVAAVLLVAVLANVDGLVQVAQGTWRVAMHEGSFPQFDFWRSSRMMPPDPPGWEINEFPYFTFLFADPHAHLFAIPLALLCIGLSLALLLQVRRNAWAVAGVTLAVLALLLGALNATNSWDYPSYLLLGAGALGAGAWLRGGRIGGRVALALAGAGLLLVLSRLTFLPFLDRSLGFFEGVTRSKTQTALWQYLAINATAFLIAATFLVVSVSRVLRPMTARLLTSEVGVPAPAAGITAGRNLALWRTLSVLPAIVGAAVAVTALVLAGYATVAMLVACLGLVTLIGIRALARRDDEEAAPLVFAMMMLGGAIGLGVLVDLVSVKGDIDRMNTVFKLGLEAWVLYGVAGGYLLWDMLSSARKAGAKRVSRRWMAWAGVLAFVVFACAIYPVLGARTRLADRFSTDIPLTLNGMAYMKTAQFDDKGVIDLEQDAQAIRWLQRNVQGSPVVLEGFTDQYHWGARISIYTGLPSVLGWAWHQIQQRGQEYFRVDQRQRDVTEAYTTPNLQRGLQMLNQYNVRYVYVGQLERNYYPLAGLEKFDSMATQGLLRVVYQQDGVTIYERPPA